MKLFHESSTSILFMTLILYNEIPYCLLNVDFRMFFIGGTGPLWTRETRRGFHLYEVL